MLPNVVFKLVPTPRTTVMIATEIPAATLTGLMIGG